jgi:hypothetical protein|tara:strand:- start:269 stop:457 length:189 start_codon:yes stop_codon:yes gene_type:complete
MGQGRPSSSARDAQVISLPKHLKTKNAEDVAGFKKIIPWQTKLCDFAMIFLDRLANHKGNVK